MLTELTPGQEKPDDHALLKVCDVCPRAGGYFIIRSCCQSDKNCQFFWKKVAIFYVVNWQNLLLLL